jgi:zinc/manganese transport system ATP-binding protein
MSAAVILEGVVAVRGRRVVLDRVDGAFVASSATAIIGPNGAGKSSLLDVLAGRLRPVAGHVRIADGLRVGYLPQHPSVERDAPLRVRDLVLLGRLPRLGGWRGADEADRRAVDEAVAAVGLSDRADRTLGDLSGGEWRRALLARLIAAEPDIILLDEPFVALDRASGDLLVSLVRRWTDLGRTVVCAMHDEHRACEAFTTTLLLDGRVVAWGPTATLLAVGDGASGRRLAAAA